METASVGQMEIFSLTESIADVELKYLKIKGDPAAANKTQ